jgi:hypothetical protein
MMEQYALLKRAINLKITGKRLWNHWLVFFEAEYLYLEQAGKSQKSTFWKNIP